MKGKNGRQQGIRTKRASEKLCDADSNKRQMGKQSKWEHEGFYNCGGFRKGVLF